jgi:hypothetical protein
LSSGQAVRSTDLSDFTTTSIAANDIIAVNLFAVSGATYVNFTMECV